MPLRDTETAGGTRSLDQSTQRVGLIVHANLKIVQTIYASGVVQFVWHYIDGVERG